MPRIINAYSEGQNSIADSLKSIGQSIWGDEAKNEGLRQNAEKLHRENTGRMDAASAFERGDYTGMGSAGIRGGMSAADTSGYGRYNAALRARGNQDDPTLGTMSMGAGEAMSSTALGQRRALENARAMEQDRTDAAKYTPIYNEGRYGKEPAGALNTRTGEMMPFGAPAQQPGFGAPAQPSPRGAPQVGYQPAGLQLTDEHDQPIPPASTDMKLLNSVDEHGQPILSPEGKQRLMAMAQQDPGYAGQVLATIVGHAPPPNSRSKQNMGFMRDVYSVYPNFDYGVAGMRNATYKDIATSGKTGQMSQALNQVGRHGVEVLIPAMHAMGMSDTLHPFSGTGPIADAGNWVAGQLTRPYNAAHLQSMQNQQDPRLASAKVAREVYINEFEKVLRTSGMAEADVQRALGMFHPGMSDPEFRAAMGTSQQAIRGAVKSREDNINRVLGPDAQRAPLMSPETEDLYRQIEAWSKGGPMPVMPQKGSGQMPAGQVGGGGGTQPATALPAGPSGHPPSINDRPQEHPMLAEARAAIAAGKSRAAVIQRLQQMGVDPQGL